MHIITITQINLEYIASLMMILTLIALIGFVIRLPMRTMDTPVKVYLKRMIGVITQALMQLLTIVIPIT